MLDDLGVSGFPQKIVTQGDGVGEGLAVGLAGEHYADNGGVLLMQQAQQLVTVHAGHTVVADHHGDFRFAHQINPLRRNK
nr:hypothetical protein [Desulfuromonas thiophila]